MFRRPNLAVRLGQYPRPRKNERAMRPRLGTWSAQETACDRAFRQVVDGSRTITCRNQKGVAQLDAGNFYDEKAVFSEINAEIDQVESD